MPRRRSPLPISHLVAATPTAALPRIYCTHCDRDLSDRQAEEVRDYNMSSREIGEWACGCLRRYQDMDGGENLD